MTDVENLKSLHMWINSHCSTFCCILHCFVAFSVAIYRRCADLTKVSMPQTHIAPTNVIVALVVIPVVTTIPQPTYTWMWLSDDNLTPSSSSSQDPGWNISDTYLHTGLLTLLWKLPLLLSSLPSITSDGTNSMQSVSALQVSPGLYLEMTKKKRVMATKA